MALCRRLLLLLPCLVLLAGAAPVVHLRIDRSLDRFELHADLSYVLTATRDMTLLTPRGLHAGGRASRSFYPDHQSLEVQEAWVEQPDGSRIEVPRAGMFTRPSAASQSAPGFVGSQTTTVLFPQLLPGSRTHIVWRMVQKTPPLLGFNTLSEPAFEAATGSDTTEIELPATVKLEWRARGGFEVSDVTTDGVRRISAAIRDVAPRERERDMVAQSDFVPLFAATTLPDLQAIGAIYYRQTEGRAQVTPEIAALAERIAGGRSGLAAARAIYDWVAGNIRYVAVYLDPDDGWVPHAAGEVLAHGYGDCKDHVVLMQALLAARGIRAEAGIIDWGSRTRDLPLWLPTQFNHVVVYLPAYDRYANPTDPYSSFDALERRLSGKTVVLATPAGKVARTPPARAAENRYVYRQRIALDAQGTLSGEARLVMSANLDSELRTAVANSSSLRDMAERVLARTPEGGFGSFSAGDPRDLSRPFDVSAAWTSPNGVTFQGREAFLRVPSGTDVEPANALRGKLSRPGTRQTPILADVGEYVWETTLAPAPGLAVTRLPGPVALHTAAGTYRAEYVRQGRDVLVTRRLVISRDVVAPEAYPELERLLQAPIDDARSVLVLERE